jgi:hypothetical protein
MSIAKIHSATLPTIDVSLTVTKFPRPAPGSVAITDHLMELRTFHPNVDWEASDPDLLRVRGAGARIRFQIITSPEDYAHPVGIAFSWIKSPKGKKAANGCSAFESAGRAPLLDTGDSPFGALQLNGPTLEITDAIDPSGSNTKKTYSFVIFIQRISDGAIGLIDPCITNDR